MRTALGLILCPAGGRFFGLDLDRPGVNRFFKLPRELNNGSMQTRTLGPCEWPAALARRLRCIFVAAAATVKRLKRLSSGRNHKADHVSGVGSTMLPGTGSAPPGRIEDAARVETLGPSWVEHTRHLEGVYGRFALQETTVFGQSLGSSSQRGGKD